MIKEWREFLDTQGAVIENGVTVHFGQPQAELEAAANDTVLYDLSHLSFIRVQGADALAFLQGQLTNDVAVLDPAHSQLNGYCNPKGRLLAIMRLFRRGNDILIQLPNSLRDAIVQRLRMYVLRAKVTLDAEQDLIAIGLAGAKAETLLPDHIDMLTPVSEDTCITAKDVTLLRIPGTAPRFEIIATASKLMSIWRQFKSGVTTVGPSTWRWLDIMAGMPNIYPETSEAFVPQMTNLDQLAGINFTKGCYTGQEIVARMHYLGKLKQRMYRGHTHSQSQPLPGDAIYAPDHVGQSTGTVVDSQVSPEGGYDLLAVIHTSSIEAGQLHLLSEDGPLLTIQQLPYGQASS